MDSMPSGEKAVPRLQLMHEDNIIATQPLKWSEPATLEGRPGEDGLPFSGERAALERSVS